MFNMANFYTKRAAMKFSPFFLIPLMCVAELPKPLCPIPANATYFAVGAGLPFETSFEEQAPENVDENPHSGKQCYKYQGDGKYSYRKFILALEPEVSYEVTMMVRKEVCSPEIAKQMDMAVCNYAKDSKKADLYFIGGKDIPGQGNWHELRFVFKTKNDMYNCGLMLYNRTNLAMWIDDLKIRRLDEQEAASAEAKIVNANLVDRPLPPAIDTSNEDWMFNRRGIEALDPNFILPPFTPIKASENSVEVWGRTYLLGQHGLPEEVTALDEQLFAKGMEFSATVNEKEEIFKPEYTTILRKHKGVVEYLSRMTGETVDAEIRTQVEYDGMMRIDFTIIPRGCVALNHFNYKITMDNTQAKYLHYTGSRDSGMSLNVQKSSFTMAIPKQEGLVWESPFKLLVWLGSEDKGFLWFTSSEKEWNPLDREKRPDALKVVRGNAGTSLQITPVSSELLIARPTTWTFGLMATPARPKPKGWRGNSMNYDYFAADAEKYCGQKVKVLYSSGSYDYLPPASPNKARVGFYPRIYDDAIYKERIAREHAKGRLFGIYIDPILCNLGIYKELGKYKAVTWNPVTDNAEAQNSSDDSDFLWQAPEIKKYFGEWTKLPVSTAPYGSNRGERQFQPGLGSRYADFFCFLMEQHAKCGVDGVANLDEWGPTADCNLMHDAGWLGRDGKVYPEYDWWARRDLVKRLCAVFLKERGKMPIMFVHTAATMLLPSASFCEACLTGELWNTAYYRNPGVYDKYGVNKEKILQSLNDGGADFLYWAAPPERWVIESGTPFGWYCQMMANFTKSPDLSKEYSDSDAATRDYVMMCLLHDNLIYPIFCKPQAAWKAIKIKQDFGIADDAVEYFPYYGKKIPVKATNGKEIYAVSYKNGKKWLAIVGNASLENQEILLCLNSDYIQSASNITDAESGEILSLASGEVKISVPRRDYRMLLINE